MQSDQQSLEARFAALTPIRKAVYTAWWEIAHEGGMPGPTTVSRKLNTTHGGADKAIRALTADGFLPRRPTASCNYVDPEWRRMAQEALRVVDRGIPPISPLNRPAPVLAPFSAPSLPSALPPVEELIERRIKDHQRLHVAVEARRLIEIPINITGPIGITHLGDPHVDDDGCDLAALKRDIEVINATEGLFGANVGDSNNNWTGRLGHLYGRQGTSAEEAWLLTEWLVKSVPWLYILAGNHGAWSGAGDPLNWLVSHAGVFDKWGARLNLKFPNGKQVRVNARHDFVGHSQWNTAHGVMKAAQMGWRDHILTCGHLHTSGYGLVKDPATGLISHAIRVAGYKRHDEYAAEKGLPNQSVSPSVTTILDPRFEDNDPRLIKVFWSTEDAADYLTWLRAKK